MKKLTLTYIGSGRKMTGESVFTNEQWMLWPLKWPGAISHSPAPSLNVTSP